MELERIGFIPRSILRMLDRFYHQLSIGTAEPLVKQFRFSKYLLLTSVKSLVILIFLPIVVNFFTKTYVFRPIIEYFWDKKQTEIFLNYDLQEKAFYQMKDFEDKIFFESLVKSPMTLNLNLSKIDEKTTSLAQDALSDKKTIATTPEQILSQTFEQKKISKNSEFLQPVAFFPIGSLTEIEHKLSEKTMELAEESNMESREAITNLLSDMVGLLTLCFLLIQMKMSVMNTTAFLFESFFSLKDSKKSFIMLLFTDLLVGFHSPRGWEVIFDFIFEHFGLPQNHNIILLLVGTFPVLLDALFKYWIFRHLNRHSPATVATYQSMVE
jgi:hypothetical protein